MLRLLRLIGEGALYALGLIGLLFSLWLIAIGAAGCKKAVDPVVATDSTYVRDHLGVGVRHPVSAAPRPRILRFRAP